MSNAIESLKQLTSNINNMHEIKRDGYWVDDAGVRHVSYSNYVD